MPDYQEIFQKLITESGDPSNPSTMALLKQLGKVLKNIRGKNHEDRTRILAAIQLCDKLKKNVRKSNKELDSQQEEGEGEELSADKKGWNFPNSFGE